MKLFITHNSALEYWRAHPHSAEILKRRRRNVVVPNDPPTAKALDQFDLHGLSLPLSVAVGSKNARRISKRVKTHVIDKPLPEGSMVDVGNGLFVASPELCFVQMAASLPFANLIELGIELCGTYSLCEPDDFYDIANPDDYTPFDDYENNGIIKRDPLTDVKKLSAFVARMTGAPGQRKAARALRYIVDGSASPRETLLVIMLTLPYNLGGYKLVQPTMNARIVVDDSSKGYNGKSVYYCDLFWPAANLAVEYDSDIHHTGASRLASDSIRRGNLASVGITVVTVTNQQVKNILKFEKLARFMADRLKKNLRYDENPGFVEAQRQLRKLLL